MDNFTHSLTGWALGQAGLKRKTRKGLTALMFCVPAFALPGCATTGDFDSEIATPQFNDDAPISVIVGEAGRQVGIGSPACPEKMICMDAVFDIRLTRQRLLKGPRVPDAQVLRIVQHGAMPTGRQVALLVRPERSGRYWAISRALPDDGKACFMLASDHWQRAAMEEQGYVLENDQLCVTTAG